MIHWYVYIMANKPSRVIYIGVTDNIVERVREH
ncbi:GIY-YIG nuclease family protein [Psychroserpens mesophilus]|nr:GIY-YIG nuclease family protein [Psychroserpens mesophilus]